LNRPGPTNQDSGEAASYRNRLNTAALKILPDNCFFNTRLVSDPRDPLFPIEAEFVAKAVDKRRNEFAAGRSAARAALRQLGLTARPLPIGPGGAPQWPEGVVGSITHTSQFALAVAGARSTFLSIGVDVENAMSVTENLWKDFLRPAELAFLMTLPSSGRQSAAASIFSLKEAFYKFQYPITQAWLDFQEVEVTFSDRASVGNAQITGTRNNYTWSGKTFPGTVHVESDLVFASVLVSA
jgi:4'-phosphopantetheinyl transferase EntD